MLKYYSPNSINAKPPTFGFEGKEPSSAKLAKQSLIIEPKHLKRIGSSMKQVFYLFKRKKCKYLKLGHEHLEEHVENMIYRIL